MDAIFFFFLQCRDGRGKPEADRVHAPTRGDVTDVTCDVGECSKPMDIADLQRRFKSLQDRIEAALLASPVDDASIQRLHAEQDRIVGFLQQERQFIARERTDVGTIFVFTRFFPYHFACSFLLQLPLLSVDFDLVLSLTRHKLSAHSNHSMILKIASFCITMHRVLVILAQLGVSLLHNMS
jgi:hypothetical protein